MKDYYAILNIEPGSSTDVIKKAYRRIALKIHPDKDASNGEKFRELNEAYKYLLDHPYIAVPKTIVKPARARKGTDIYVNLMVTAEEIAKQISKHIEITRIVPCGVCNGTGAQARALIKCPKCGGNGIDVVASVMGEKKFCSGCGGYGTVQPDRNCKSCEGKGLLTVKVRKEIKLSKKFTLEQISFPREGHFVLGSETPGNLVIKPILEKKSPFEVDGKNIRGKARISPAQAVLGDIYYVDVFGEMIKIEIKPHTKDGAIIELKDKGVQKGKSRGALILKVIIEIPNKITEEERKLYDQLLSIQKGTNL